MSGESKRTALIGQLYQIAVDPLYFEEFLESWDEKVIGYSRETQDQIRDHELEDHAIRASRVIARVDDLARDLIPPPLAETIELDDNPAIIVSKAGKILSGNTAAHTQFGVEAPAELARAMELRAKPGHSLSALTARIARDSPDMPGIVGLWEIETSDASGTALFALSRARCHSDPRVGGLLTALAPVWNERTARVLRDHFQLTEAETDIVKTLVAGNTAFQIAELRGTSAHTVRTQIKTILSKTGFGSQVDLIRHLGFLQKLEFPSPAIQKRAEGNEQLLTLSNRRKLSYRLVGPVDGMPALYIHGLIDSVAFTSRIHDALHDRGILLIVPERPNFGGSDPYPKASEPLFTFADYCGELLDSLEIERIPLLGHMAGALYAHAFAARHPERCVGLLSVAGAVPMTNRQQFSGMSKGHRIAGLTARHAPGFLPLLIRGGIQLLRRQREDVMLRLYFRDAPHDLDFTRDQEIRDMVLARFEFATAQGYRAFHTDIQEVSRDWSPLADKVRCQTVLVHGAHDKVVLIEGVTDFAQRRANRRAVISEDSGQLIWSREPDLVLDELAALFRDDAPADWTREHPDERHRQAAHHLPV